MKKIWKYPLTAEGFQVLSMPIASSILSVKEQFSKITLYALVDVPEEGEIVKCNRHVKIVGTGHDIKDLSGGYLFIDTVKMMGGQLMFHVFVREEPI